MSLFRCPSCSKVRDKDPKLVMVICVSCQIKMSKDIKREMSRDETTNI